MEVNINKAVLTTKKEDSFSLMGKNISVSTITNININSDSGESIMIMEKLKDASTVKFENTFSDLFRMDVWLVEKEKNLTEPQIETNILRSILIKNMAKTNILNVLT